MPEIDALIIEMENKAKELDRAFEQNYVADLLKNAIQTIRELQDKLLNSCPSNCHLLECNAVCEDDCKCDFKLERENSKSEEVCEWRIVDRPNGFPIFNTSCGAIRLACAKGIDIYCNACGRKIKVVE